MINILSTLFAYYKLQDGGGDAVVIDELGSNNGTLREAVANSTVNAGFAQLNGWGFTPPYDETPYDWRDLGGFFWLSNEALGRPETYIDLGRLIGWLPLLNTVGINISFWFAHREFDQIGTVWGVFDASQQFEIGLHMDINYNNTPNQLYVRLQTIGGNEFEVKGQFGDLLPTDDEVAEGELQEPPIFVSINLKPSVDNDTSFELSVGSGGSITHYDLSADITLVSDDRPITDFADIGAGHCFGIGAKCEFGSPDNTRDFVNNQGVGSIMLGTPLTIVEREYIYNGGDGRAELDNKVPIASQHYRKMRSA